MTTLSTVSFAFSHSDDSNLRNYRSEDRNLRNYNHGETTLMGFSAWILCLQLLLSPVVFLEYTMKINQTRS